MMDQYNCLNKAQLNFEYLHTNSTTHTFLFGALAELVDNSRDAGATNLDIYTCKNPYLRGGFYLSFLDDGCGMNYDDVFNIIVFGKSSKRTNLDSTQIGQYGNGLKSGSMRISNDLILFTKKENLGTCLFLSRTFHREENLSQIICPMPCFNLLTQQAIDDNQQMNGTRTYTYDKVKHDLEMELIFKYSPFKTIEDLFKQFDLIKSSSGTLIILYNVKLSDTGEAELDIKTDPYDILIDSKNRQNLFDDNDENIPLEYRSFRAYVSILYYEPRMRITIQQQRVITKKLAHILYKPRQYQFKSTRFKTRSEQEIKQYEKEFQLLEERIREADSQIHDVQQRLDVTTIDERIKLRKLQINSAELKDIANRLQNGLAKKRLEMNNTKTLNFMFGLNIQNRIADGIFIYNCGRLIKMYEKIGPTNKKTLYCRGIIGIVDIPSIVLEPTHNKQAFADEKEYHFLLKNIGEFMRQYWTDTGIEHYVKEFWETYGYRDDQLDRPPSNDPEIIKRRQVAVPMLIQCDQCLKWRRLPYSSNAILLTQSQLQSWQCSDSTDVLNNSCTASEKLEVIPEGELKPKQQTGTTGNNKRPSTAEISSTTVSISTRSNIVSEKRSTPPSRSLSARAKSKKKRKRPISKQSKTKNHDTTSDEDIESYPIFNRTSSSNPVYKIDDGDDDDTENIDNTEINTNGLLPPPTIGARVWAMYQGARRSGKVLNVNDKHGVFKMRFDDFPTAEFDYSFEYNSPAWSYIGAPPPPPTTTDLMITSVETPENENEPLSNIAKKFKTLIKFMLPPNWDLTREQISSMSYDELSQFDVNVFMQSYREKMAKIVEQRKADEAHWRTSAQRLQTEVTGLLNLSGMSIPTDCSMEDFEQHVQSYTKQADK